MSFQQHHAWYVAPAWGHMTSANALLVRMLQLNPALVVTYVIHAMVGEKTDVNLAQYPDVPWDRLNLVKAGDPAIGALGMGAMKTVVKQMSECWLETLTKACSEGQAWPKPTAVVLDQAGSLMLLPQTKIMVGAHCKTYMHWTSGASCLYGFLAPSTKSGFSDFEEIVERYYVDETLRKGRGSLEITEQVSLAKNGTDELNGSIMKVPGVKDMYDYEREMSNCPAPAGLGLMLGEMVNLAKQTDGVIAASSVALEGPALDACNKYTKTFPVGIQLAPRGWGENGLPIKDDVLRTFLEKHGKQKVIFISFGSMFFPITTPQYVTSMLSILEEINFPFVFLLGGIMASNAITPDTVTQINERGIGLIYTSWLDQQAILQHPSIGWFLSHGGWNSVAESLAQGVPLIGWPMAQCDQAINVALCATREKPVAFELMQIRQGRAKQPPMRGGVEIVGDDESVKREFKEVFAKARGEVGKVIRGNAEALAVKLREERDGRAEEVIWELASI